MPVALISTRTSPAFGPSRSTSTISSGFWASKATAARVFIVNSSNSRRTPRFKSRLGSKRSLLAHAGIFRRCIGFVLVLVLAGPGTAPGLVGAGAQIDVEIVHVAGDVRVIAEGRHHVLRGGRDVLAARGHDAEEIGIAHGLERVLQRRRVGGAHSVRAVADMAVRVIAAVSGIGVPVHVAVGRDLVGRVALLIEPFAIFVLLDGSRVTRAVRDSNSSGRNQEHRSNDRADFTQEIFLGAFGGRRAGAWS